MVLVKFTHEGAITVECRTFEEPEGLRNAENVAVEIVVSDTGCGISSDKLESIFREFEQVEAMPPPPPLPSQPKGLGTDGFAVVVVERKLTSYPTGLGLAVVARIVEQLGGQLRVDSKVDKGSCFSFLIPFNTGADGNSSPSSQRSRAHSRNARETEIESLVSALQSYPHPMTGSSAPRSTRSASSREKAAVIIFISKRCWFIRCYLVGPTKEIKSHKAQHAGPRSLPTATNSCG